MRRPKTRALLIPFKSETWGQACDLRFSPPPSFRVFACKHHLNFGQGFWVQASTPGDAKLLRKGGLTQVLAARTIRRQWPGERVLKLRVVSTM